MILWTLAIIGIAINFLAKFNARKVRKNFDPIFWIKDNWPELVQALLWVIAFMIMITSEDAVIDFTWVEKYPIISQLPAKMVASIGIGYFCTDFVYWINKKKSKYAKDKET